MSDAMDVSPDHRVIYLLRHGEPVLKASGRCYVGQIDPPLSPAGADQARQWQHRFQNTPLTAVMCSDLQRSVQTARIIAQGRTLKISPIRELREINLGDWDGLPFATVRAMDRSGYEQRGIDPVGHRPPNGESFGDLQRRVIPAFERIIEQTENDILIVGHAGVNRVILCHLLGIPLSRLFHLAQNYAKCNILTLKGNEYRLHALNADQVAHQ
jgi:probable phosphoglycerate mutase